MNGYTPGSWTSIPRGRQGKAARNVWLAVHQTTGKPPSMIEYIPPMRRTDEGEVLRTSRWVVHHEGHRYEFRGGSKVAVEAITTNGLAQV